MKKWFCFLLALSLAIVPAAFCAAKEKITSGDYTYVILEDGTLELYKYIGTDFDVTVPAALDGYPVTVIGENAFDFNNNLQSVTISEGITTIGYQAFCLCENLQTVTLPNSLTEIVENPFAGSMQVSFVLEPAHPCLELIGGVLFNTVEKRLVCYPDGLQQTGYVVPDGTEIIGASAFNCVEITSIEFPDSVKEIGAYALTGCLQLESVELPEHLETIGEGAFYTCDNLREVHLPEGVTTIGEKAFEWCLNLREINIPASVSDIGRNAFAYCDYVTLTVAAGSYGETYAKENDLPCQVQKTSSN